MTIGCLQRREFASRYARDCFRCSRLGADETWKVQKQLHALKAKVEDFVARAYIAGCLTECAEAKLRDTRSDTLATKESDLMSLVNRDVLPPELRSEAVALESLAKDHEALQLLASLRAMRDSYETILPRLLYVIRRVIKKELCLPPTKVDNRLQSVSEALGWYRDHLQQGHPMYLFLVTLGDYYKTARNVANHHEGFSWHPEVNEVWLQDRTHLDRVPLHDFQKRYRYLASYLCDYGVRGVLAAYTQYEHGPVAKELLVEYNKVFPEDFGVGPVP